MLKIIAITNVFAFSVFANGSLPPNSATTSTLDDLVIDAKLTKAPIVGDNTLLIKIDDASKRPIKNAEIALEVAMTNMDMGTKRPKVENNGDGTYAATVNFSMAGPWRVSATVQTPGHSTQTIAFDFKVMASGANHAHEMKMRGRLGDWSMSREGSGTSWLPDSSPMFMKMMPNVGSYEVNAMGFITFNVNDSGGKRGKSKFYSNSMLMLMARRETGGGTVGLSLMTSLDPIFNGEYGYPDLFQTGETAYGKKLTDDQHPHDVIVEATASYSHPISKKLNAFVYGGPVGEPALGGPTFMHRPSGMEIPEAPISHHWFDSTHISSGVLTLGVNTDKWQLEGSVFNGHEPDENRYSPDPIRLNSASARFTYNPTANLSFNTSYGYLKSPERSEPGIDQHRFTVAGLLSHPCKNGDNFSLTAAFGRNSLRGKNSDSFLAEATYLHGPTSIFGRWEHVDKDELGGVPDGNYMINKFIVGGVQNFVKAEGLDIGLGAYAGVYIFPSSLKRYYGKSPVSAGIFIRIRPGRMQH